MTPCCIVLAAVLPLFEKGTTAWKVVVEQNAPACVRFAAEELTNAVKRISGAEMSVVTSDVGVARAIRIRAAGDEWAKESVSYRLEGGDLVISGNQPRAALHATYAFLDRELGVRWLWPGEDGSFYPTLKTWDFPSNFGFDHEPAIWFRGFHHCGARRGRDEFLLWQTRNYANIHRHGNGRGEERYGQYSMFSTHNATLSGDAELFKTHPECYALLGGKRSLANICFSSDFGAEKVADNIARHVDILSRAASVDIVSIFPNDNQDYCECPSCKAKGVSDGWFEYLNKVVKILRARYPKIRFATIAYQGYLQSPNCRLDGVEFVEYASHGRCHVHDWDDPTCSANVAEMKRLDAWCARTDVNVGHYAYEYDAVIAHPVFAPFFSVVGNAVETAVRKGLVAQISEVGLSPPKGPETSVDAVKNRLTILYYARKMWQPSLTLEAFLDDLCGHAYGAAAKPMKEYFLLMDAAWRRMTGRVGLFADGAIVSADLLRDGETRRRSAALLDEAEAIVAKNDTRSLRNVRRERFYHRQWNEYRDAQMGNSRAFNLPKAEDGQDSPEGASSWMALKTDESGAASASVRGWWCPKREIVFAFDGVAEGKVSLTDAHAERHEFSFAGDRKTQRCVSDVGVEKALWKPEWTIERRKNGVVLRLPRDAFAHPPAVNEKWDVRFDAGAAGYPVRKDMTVKLAFLQAPAADRPVVYYTGSSRCHGFVPGLRVQAESDGWSLIGCTNAVELAAAVGKADSYMFQVPETKDFTPEVAAVIRRNVRNGGSLIVRSWSTIPLQAILGDTNLVCSCEPPRNYALSERRAKCVREGDWCHKPWEFEKALRCGYAPCYMQVPKAPAGAWVDYASMPSLKDETRMIPFVSAMKYGRGVVIIVGETFHVTHFWLIDNIRRDLGL